MMAGKPMDNAMTVKRWRLPLDSLSFPGIIICKIQEELSYHSSIDPS